MSDTVKDGGPAFPTTMPALLKDGCVGQVADARGMSLRDWFAGQALAAAMAGVTPELAKTLSADKAEMTRKLAVMSYEIADAMLAARKDGSGE